MKTVNHKYRRWHIVRLFALVFFFSSEMLRAQFGPPPPPRKIVVTPTAQGLSFGAFTHGPAGGTVTVNAAGSRSSGGSVMLLGLGYSFSPALLEIVGNPGTVVTLMNGPDVLLNGSNGGSLLLHLGDSNPVSPFTLTVPYKVVTQLRIGGTLTVGGPGGNPPGSYSGTFTIIFNQP
jgi:hypothetical protein